LSTNADTHEPPHQASIFDRVLQSDLVKLQAARSLFTHGRLLMRVVRNDLAARHAASILGLGWTVVGPLLILVIYASVYLFVFRVQAVAGLSGFRYVMLIFCGLVPFLATAEAVSGGVTSIIADKALLTNTVFPIELVPIKPVITAQLTMFVGIVVILAGLIFSASLSWTVLLLPLVWLAHVLSLVGLNWVLSLLNVVFRDLQNLISAVLMILVVTSPIAYTPAMVPPQFQLFIAINPFAHFVLAYQSVLVLGQVPSVSESVILAAISLGLFAFGSWLFPRAKRVLLDYV
jgi:lipopolysaccharide transport system permease protein